MYKKCGFCLCNLFLACCFVVNAQNHWPKEIALSFGGKVTIYQPQPETLEGNKLAGRAAVSFRKSAKEEPIFGALFFTAILQTDKVTRMAELESVKISNAKFSGLENQKQVDDLITNIQNEAPKWKLKVSLDELVTTIKKENVSQGSAVFKNDPPKIMYANKPTTLVVLDGEPQVKQDEDMKAERVVNSPNLIFKEGNQWNMYAGGVWYKSSSVVSGWKQNTMLSSKVKSVNEQIKKQEKSNNDGKVITEKPQVTGILIATEPTELLQTTGEANYKSVEGTELLYVSNSSNEIFKNINTQKTYVLIAGRWYAAPGINGPWDYIAADKLPADFAKIPEGSDKDGVLANVAGTDQADEARIDAEIPQTAKVNRKTATVNVEYDGVPLFNKVEGTSLQLAENANLTVMIDPGGRYFALDNGVWFISNSANGPWTVANERPKDVENIPASSPAYNTKYVSIYDQTPDYVYTGYTSGYTGGYIYGSTVVYGTGYRYRPWFRKMYYPRPVTWGYGFHYNPWVGWSMNWGFNFGFLYIGFSSGGGYGWGGGWFGPPMYRPPYRPSYWNGGYYGNRPRPPFGGGGPVHGGNLPGGGGWSNNIYNNHKGVITKDIDRSKIARPGLVDKGNPNNKLPGNKLPIDNSNKLPGNKLPIDNSNILPGNKLPVDNSNKLPGNKLPVDNSNKLPGNKLPVDNSNKLPGNKLPVDNSNKLPGNKLPVDNSNKLPGNKLPVNNNNKLPGNTKDNKVNNPFNKDNNVLTDKDGNIFKKDPKNNDWQTRDNKTNNWKPIPEDRKISLPDLNKQQNSRERDEIRQTNFGRDVPTIKRQVPTMQKQMPATRPAVINRPSLPQTRPAEPFKKGF